MKSGQYFIANLADSPAIDVFNMKKVYIHTEHILFSNAEYLISAINHSKSKEFLELLPLNKNDKFNLYHREVGRLTHNYLLSIATYADHLRNFVSERISSDYFSKKYIEKVESTFSQNNLCMFVRHLRNYIAHKGLPNTRISINFSRNPSGNIIDGTNATAASELFYQKDDLLIWDRWPKIALEYINCSPDRISLFDVFPPHLTVMEEFAFWFRNEFDAEYFSVVNDYNEHYAEFERLRNLENNFDESNK